MGRTYRPYDRSKLHPHGGLELLDIFFSFVALLIIIPVFVEELEEEYGAAVALQEHRRDRMDTH